VKYKRVPLPFFALEHGSYGMCDHRDKIITYSDPVALAHEVAHAIEMQINGRTSEYGAWKLAYSFLKPKYWRKHIAKAAYASYVHNGFHDIDIVQGDDQSGMYRIERRFKPSRLDFLEEK
jgi:hypothetical protein